jgi:peptide deformylase
MCDCSDCPNEVCENYVHTHKADCKVSTEGYCNCNDEPEAVITTTEPETEQVSAHDLPVLPLHSEILTTRPDDFKFETDEDKKAAEELAQTLLFKMEQFNCISISAPQVGLPYRVFAYGKDGYFRVMFNPQILEASERKIEMREGCISFPGLNLKITRPVDIRVAYQDVDGKDQVETFTMYEARIILHEMDHMEGTSYLKHTTEYRLNRELNKLRTKIIKHQTRNAAYARIAAKKQEAESNGG